MYGIFRRACSRASRSHHLCPDVAQAAQTARQLAGLLTARRCLLIEGSQRERRRRERRRRRSRSLSAAAADRPAKPTSREKNGTEGAKFPAVRSGPERNWNGFQTCGNQHEPRLIFCRPDAARFSRQIPSDFNSQRTARR